MATRQSPCAPGNRPVRSGNRAVPPDDRLCLFLDESDHGDMQRCTGMSGDNARRLSDAGVLYGSRARRPMRKGWKINGFKACSGDLTKAGQGRVRSVICKSWQLGSKKPGWNHQGAPGSGTVTRSLGGIMLSGPLTTARNIGRG